MSWQPIETAPKDGTHILVCSADDCGIHSAYWRKSSWGEYWATTSYVDYKDDDDAIGWSLTHWMPLPTPPEK